MVADKNNIVQFVPYERIIIGGNEISCRYLININGGFPIIIGGGDMPHVWLYTLIDGRWIELVKDNKKVFHKMRVTIDAVKKEYTIVLEEKRNSDVILSASFKEKDVFCIRKMNLFPIGISVSANDRELVVGTNRISGNVIKGVESFIALSEK